MKTDMLRSQKPLAARHDGDIWNVFVQILLPLIIVLTFVALLEISRYRQGYIERGEEIASLARQLRHYEETNEGQRTLEYRRQLIEWQRQKLLLSMKVVFNDERKRLGFDRVIDGNAVSLNGSMVADNVFKMLSFELGRIDRNPADSEQWQMEVFKKILEGANVRPRTPSGRRNVEQTLSLRSAEEVTDENQEEVFKGIDNQRENMLRDLSEIQKKVLTRLFEAKLAAPETVDDTVSEIVRSMRIAGDSKAREQAVGDLRQYLIGDVRKSLEMNEYPFLERTWESIKR